MRRVPIFICLAYTMPGLTLTGCESTEEAAAAAPPQQQQASRAQRQLLPGLYLSELSTNLMPLQAELPNGVRSEGSGEVTVRQLLRVSRSASGDFTVSDCRGRQPTAAETFFEGLLSMAPATGPGACAEPARADQGDGQFSLRRECANGGFAALHLVKLGASETPAPIEVNLRAGEETLDAAECFETFSFTGMNSLYRDGALVGVYPSNTTHLSVSLSSNAGDLEMELTVVGEVAPGSYSWGAALSPGSDERAFSLRTTGDHPWAASDWVDGELDIVRVEPLLELRFDAQSSQGAPLLGAVEVRLQP